MCKDFEERVGSSSACITLALVNSSSTCIGKRYSLVRSMEIVADLPCTLNNYSQHCYLRHAQERQGEGRKNEKPNCALAARSSVFSQVPQHFVCSRIDLFFRKKRSSFEVVFRHVCQKLSSNMIRSVPMCASIQVL